MSALYPCWLLVHLNKCGGEAQHWQILTVLHLISGCCIQMKEQGDGLEQSGCVSAPHSMISSNCGFTKHWLCMPAFLYIYSACMHICLCTADLLCYVNHWLLQVVRRARWDRKEENDSLLDLIHPQSLLMISSQDFKHRAKAQAQTQPQYTATLFIMTDIQVSG